ncbi:MAG: hypothetical protein FD149_55 [Rhodospirillaceae bacterium]|nr:MAG: hypothetical protein FD149_55 [Rhodospirillaceae bacterium]
MHVEMEKHRADDMNEELRRVNHAPHPRAERVDAAAKVPQRFLDRHVHAAAPELLGFLGQLGQDDFAHPSHIAAPVNEQG